MSDLGAVLLALLLVLGNAFFVAAEFALVSARRSQLDPLAAEGSRMARTTIKAMENISLVIATNQLGITVCSLLLGAVGEPAMARIVTPMIHLVHAPEAAVHPVAFALGLAVVVYLHVVLGEMIPKNLSLAGPDRVALLLGTPIWAVVSVLRPIIVVINWIAAHILRPFGVALQDEVSSSYTREEVAALVEESRGEGLLEKGEYDRLAGALGFTEKPVGAVVMPLDSLATVHRHATPAEVEEICAATGFSRFPVVDEAGELMGYLHIKDVLETDEARRLRPIDDKWVRPLAGVLPTDKLHDALETLQRKGSHMARVIDEQGRSLGLITLEDTIEELVGEIRDAAHHEDPAVG